MDRRRVTPTVTALLATLTLAAGCGSGHPATTTTTHPTTRTTGTTSPSSTTATTSTAVPTPPTTATPGVSVQVTAAPRVVAVGSPVTFTVTIQAPGVLSGEDVRFGDGATTGANAGVVTCGQTSRADTTRTYTHTYTAPGTFTFSDAVSVLGPPPSCKPIDATGTATVVVAAPLAGSTANGAFLSPSRNLACQITQNPSTQVRCVSFAPPRLVTMTVDGTLTRCAGSTCELGNPASDTPVLAYGAAVGTPEFVCLSTVVGVTCSVPSGRGFTISKGGVVAVGG